MARKRGQRKCRNYLDLILLLLDATLLVVNLLCLLLKLNLAALVDVTVARLEITKILLKPGDALLANLELAAEATQLDPVGSIDGDALLGDGLGTLLELLLQHATVERSADELLGDVT